MNKEIILIDAFIKNESNEKKLIEFIQRIKKTNIPILLISNSIINQNIVELVDFYIYDKQNRLFDYNFDSYEEFILWEIVNGIKINTHHIHKQLHGLSVMVNLFTCLNFIKSFGFEYFHRIEYDTELGDETLDKITNMSDIILKENKKGYFILDFDRKSHTFQYFYSEINFFIKKIPNIREQSDYVNFIHNFYKKNEFISVEKLFFDQLSRETNIKIIDRKNWEFNDSVWNIISSVTHLDNKYKKCLSDFYHGVTNNLILTKNNEDSNNKREFFLYFENELMGKFLHEVDRIGEIKYNFIDKKIDKIEVYDGNMLFDLIETHKEKNFFEI